MQQPQEEQKIDESNHKSEENPVKTKMKLVVRSDFWGRVLEGRLQREQRQPENPYRIISCQAVGSKVGKYWGCCPHHGSRVLELNESHFLEHFDGDWDLYHVRSLPADGHTFHELFLLPQNQTIIDTNARQHFNDWRFMGTVSAGMARMDLEPLLETFLKPNQYLPYPCNHVHMQIMMDKAFDRKARDFKRKGEIKRMKKISITESSDKLQPPILHSVSNDASFTTDSTSSTVPAAHDDPSWSTTAIYCTSNPPTHGFGYATMGQTMYPMMVEVPTPALYSTPIVSPMGGYSSFWAQVPHYPWMMGYSWDTSPQMFLPDTCNM